MLTNNTLTSNLNSLGIDTIIITKLNQNNIFSTKELCILNRKKLKDIGLTDYEIKHITIKLQLHGLDLNQKNPKN